jgi:hypothetical protein
MSWPLPQDYNEAIQNPRTSFSDAELRGGGPILNDLGIPIPCSGNFADVYEVRSPSGGRWAVKCFTREVPGLRERYAAISRHLQAARLPFVVDFTFLPDGIRVHGRWYPVLKMQWVEGLTLNDFARQYADKPAMLESLLQIWVRMAARLRGAGIAHADLQHGNVLLVPGSAANSLALKLVDYDGMFVPALAGSDSGEVGHPCYQHPQRSAERTYSAEVDRFPLLLIATALCALRVGGRALWDKYNTGDNLLFREADLRAPAKSMAFYDLLNLPDERAVRLTRLTLDALKGRLESAPLLDEVLPELLAAPAPKPATAPPAEVTLVPVAVAKPVAEAEAGPLWDFEAEGKLRSVRRKGGKARWVLGVAAVCVAVLVLVAGLAALAFWGRMGRPKNQAIARNDHQNSAQPSRGPGKKGPPPNPGGPPVQQIGQGSQASANGGGSGAGQRPAERKTSDADSFVPLEVTSAKSQGGAVLTPQEDGSVLASGANPSPETYTVTARTKLRGVTALRLEVLNDPSLPSQGPGRAPNGNFVLKELTVAVQEDGLPGEPAEVALCRPRATFEQDGWWVAGAIDGDPDTGWAVMGGDRRGRAAAAYFELQRPVGFARGALFTVTMQQYFDRFGHNLGRFRLSVTTAKLPLSLNTFVPLEVTSAKSQGGAVLTPQEDGSVLASGENRCPETYTVTARTKLRGVTAIRLEVLNDPSLPSQGPGRAINGNFVLNELRVAVQEEGSAGEPAEVALRRAQATFEQEGYPVAAAVDGDPNTAWGVMRMRDRKGQAAAAVFELQEPVEFARGAVFTVTLHQLYRPEPGHNVGRFRLSATTAKRPLAVTGPPGPTQE